jgi:cytidyltransferase-like protein
MNDKKTVMVFGVFDDIHEGHRFLLREAKALGDHLIAVVMQDHIAESLRGVAPKHNFPTRFECMRKVHHVDEVAIGDGDLSQWGVVATYAPDIVVFGYDQLALKADFENNLPKMKFPPTVSVLESYEPHRYNSFI